MNNQGKIKEERKKPVCSMCRNHEVTKPSAGHKKECIFDNPEHRMACSKCTLTHERRVSWAKKIEKRRKIHKILEITTVPLPGRKRVQQLCSKCLNHKMKVPNKNHKKLCQFKFCKCSKCMEVVDSCKAFNKEAERIRQSKPKSQAQSNEPKKLIMSAQDASIDDKTCIQAENNQVTQIYLDLMSTVEPMQSGFVENSVPKTEFSNDINMDKFFNDVMDLIETNQMEVIYFLDQSQPSELVDSHYPAPRILVNDSQLENFIGMDFVNDVESNINDFLFYDFFDARTLPQKTSDL